MIEYVLWASRLSRFYIICFETKLQELLHTLRTDVSIVSHERCCAIGSRHTIVPCLTLPYRGSQPLLVTVLPSRAVLAVLHHRSVGQIVVRPQGARILVGASSVFWTKETNWAGWVVVQYNRVVDVVTEITRWAWFTVPFPNFILVRSWRTTQFHRTPFMAVVARGADVGSGGGGVLTFRAVVPLRTGAVGNLVSCTSTVGACCARETICVSIISSAIEVGSSLTQRGCSTSGWTI